MLFNRIFNQRFTFLNDWGWIAAVKLINTRGGLLNSGSISTYGCWILDWFKLNIENCTSIKYSRLWNAIETLRLGPNGSGNRMFRGNALKIKFFNWMQFGGITSQNAKWHSHRNSGKSCSSTSKTLKVPYQINNKQCISIFLSYISLPLNKACTLYSNWVCFASSVLRRNGARNLNKSSNNCWKCAHPCHSIKNNFNIWKCICIVVLKKW